MDEHLTRPLVGAPLKQKTGQHRSGGTKVEKKHGGRRGGTFEQRYGYSWDLCIIFPVKTLPGRESAANIVRRLCDAGLETYLYRSVQQDEIICKIRAPLERLARHADDIDHLMLLKEVAIERVLGEGSPNPPIAGRRIAHDPTITLYRPYQFIYGKFDTSPRLSRIYYCPPYLDHPFTSVHRIKLIRRIIEDKSSSCAGLELTLAMGNGSILGHFPLHDEPRREELCLAWLKKWAYPQDQPVDMIKDYLGERIAMYFAFLGHYTCWLGPMAILGTTVFVDQMVEWDVDATLTPYFCVFVALWAVIMLEYWKRTESQLAMRWGMSSFEEEENDRPQFKGVTIPSFVDGTSMTYYPREEYLLQQVLANLLIFCMLLVVIASVGAILYVKELLAVSDVPFLRIYGSYIGSVLLSIEIQLLNYIYKNIAVRLAEWENHRTDTTFEDHLIAKLFLFQFVNSYASLFYMAFIQTYTDEGCPEYGCMYDLAQSLAIIFSTRLLLANGVEIYQARASAWWSEKKEREGVSADVHFSEPEMEYTMRTYHEMMGPLEDMSELSIQFGYTTLFVTAFPLAPALAWISNYAEIRVDAVKVLLEHRRPYPLGRQDIGTYQMVFTAIAIVSVGTNAGLVFFTSNEVPWDIPERVWGFAVMQYVIMLVMLLFAMFVKDVPETVDIQLRRQKLIVSKVIEQVPDDVLPYQARTLMSTNEPLELYGGDDAPPARTRNRRRLWSDFLS